MVKLPRVPTIEINVKRRSCKENEDCFVNDWDILSVEINLQHITSLCFHLKDKYPNFEVGLKCILMVIPYLLLCSYINQKAM